MENQTEVNKANKQKKHEQLKEEKDNSKDEFGKACAEEYKEKNGGENLEEKENVEKQIWHKEGK